MIFLFALITGLFLFTEHILKLPKSLCSLFIIPIIIFILYLGFVIQPIIFFYDFLIFISSLGGLAYAWNLLKQPSFKACLSPIIILLFFLWIWLITHNMAYRQADSFHFWGLRGHQLFLNHTLPGSGDGASHLEYPLASPIWQYFFFQSVNNWSMPLGSLAQNILVLAPLTTVFLFKPWQKSLILFTLVFFLLLFFDKHGLHNLYVDNVLSTWTASVLIAFYANHVNQKEKQFHLLWLLPALMLLVLLKPAGIFFASFALSMMFIHALSNKKIQSTYRDLLVLLFGICAAKFAWNAYIAYQHFPIALDFSKSAWSYNTWHDLFFPKDSLHQKINHLFIMGLIWNQRIDRCHSTALVLSFVLIFLWVYLQKRKTKEKLTYLPSNTSLAVITLFGIIYFISLWLIYSSVFTAQEALNLGSYSRYARIYFMAVYMTVGVLLFSSFEYQTKPLTFLSLGLFSLIIILSISIEEHNSVNMIQFKQVQIVMAENNIDPEKNQILFLWQKLDPLEASPAEIFDLVYLPKIFNSGINNCQTIEISNQNQTCHFTEQTFWKIALAKEDEIILVAPNPELAEKIGQKIGLSNIDKFNHPGGIYLIPKQDFISN